MKNFTITSNFQQAVIEAGITPPQSVEIDGHFHRFSTNGKTADNAGWYIRTIRDVKKDEELTWTYTLYEIK